MKNKKYVVYERLNKYGGGKSIYEYTDKVLDEQTDIRNIEFSDLNKDEAEDWYTDGKFAFDN